MIRPKGYKTFKSRRQVYEASADYLSASANENGFYSKESDRYVVYGFEGDIMQVFYIFNSIQPPGCLHEVYTPTPSITRGGHFYSYNSLHHTKFSRSLDILTEDSFSNQTHPSVSLTLMMMTAALPKLNEYRKSSFFYLLNI